MLFNNTSNSVKLLSLHPNLAFKLTKANTANNLMKVVQVEYNGFFESLFILIGREVMILIGILMMSLKLRTITLHVHV